MKNNIFMKSKRKNTCKTANCQASSRYYCLPFINKLIERIVVSLKQSSFFLLIASKHLEKWPLSLLLCRIDSRIRINYL